MSYEIWEEELVRLCEQWYVEYPSEDGVDHIRTEQAIADMLVADMVVSTDYGMLTIKKNPDGSITMSDGDCIDSLFDCNTQLYVKRDKHQRVIQILTLLLTVSVAANCVQMLWGLT